MVYFQNVFHGGDEGGVAVGWDDPLIFQMRFENVFFSTRPMVLSLARSTIFSSTTLSSNRLSVHRDRPLGGSEQASAIITATGLDTAPAWWPEGRFGSWRLDNLRQLLLHVITETACHAGHLDAARELIDGKQWLVLA